MPIYEIHNKRPVIGEGTWVASSAHIIGDVTIGRNCFVGFGAIIRGDFGVIKIGDETAVEENVVIHTATETEIGSGVIIGHMVMIRDALIGDSSVIGMHSTLCNNCAVGEWSIVGEQSLVLKNQIIPPYTIYGGSPARELGKLEERHRQYIVFGRDVYVKLAKDYAKGLIEL